MLSHPFPQLTRRRFAAASVLLAGAPAFAQIAALAGATAAWPNRPLRLLVGYSAGGGVDAMARLLALRLAEPLGQQVVVENRAGATSVIAADAVAKAAPDGYTLMLADSALLVSKILNPRQPLDPLTAFAPVAGAFHSPLMIVAGNQFPANNPRELVQLLKASPGKYSYATSGIGTVQHLGFEMFKNAVGAFVVHIPYRGAAQIVPDVISGQVPLGVVSATAGMAQAKAGRLKAIALMSPGKPPGMETIAALADAVPGFNAVPYLFLLAPAGTPADVVSRLSEAVKLVLEAPATTQAAAAQGGVRSYLPAAQLGPHMARESAAWQQVIREQKISADNG